MNTSRASIQDLAIERTAPTSGARRRRPWISRYVIPGIVILGFVALLIFAAGEQFLPRKSVTVVPVVVTRAEVQQEGTELFQAAGWVEPRPTPVNAAALTEGVVSELLVVEGEEVTAGQPVAKLIDVDAKLALRQAKITLALRQADLDNKVAELEAAQLRVDNPNHLDAQLAEAESALARTQTSLAEIPFLIQSAEADVAYAQQNLDGKISAGNAVAGRLVQEAESQLAAAKSRLAELIQRTPRLEQELRALQNNVKALSSQRELLVEETRQLNTAKAKKKSAEVSVEDAELAVEKAELALERTVVRAPIAGRVLSLVARPGTRVQGTTVSSGESSTVVSLYDPSSLQVRADVRLEDVPMVQNGQPVTIETASSASPLIGRVLMSTSTANIQKNTLEVKVAIDNPPPTVRPEMLVTATFLAPPQPEQDGDEPSESERLLVPKQLVQKDGESSFVWIVDADGVARQRAVQIGKATKGELVEISQGVVPTDKIISTGHQDLVPGTRVTIAGEDASLGMASKGA